MTTVDAPAGADTQPPATPGPARSGTLPRVLLVALGAGVLTLIGALTVSRVVTDQALSDATLRNAEDSITGSQTTGRKKAKTSG